MRLGELAQLLAGSRLNGDGSTAILGVQTDHRRVKPGDLFVCIPGQVHDGHHYAAMAAESGASALLVERDVEVELPKLFVRDSRQAMGYVASHAYGYPSRELNLIGVTGTNGKTTITFILDHIMTSEQYKTGVMGTIYTKIGHKVVTSERTTQEALDLQSALREMCDEGVSYCFMEVSSHALELGRVKGCRFRTAIFTNLTQDHLDYHLTMERYRDAKALLFARLGNDYSPNPQERQFAVLNADDAASDTFARVTAVPTIWYGIDQPADVTAHDIRFTLNGTEFHLDTFAGSADVKMKLIGKFNVYNVLAAVSAALLEQIPLAHIVSALETIEPTDGRMQTVDAGQPYLTLVDYAHTPDGLENALRSIREFAGRKVITVFGCGGDRDRTKRPIMGSIATRYSDFVVVTSDNPRSEDPDFIISEVEQGIVAAGFPSESYVLLPDRREAIEKAVSMAEPGDVLLIAGKGHEAYQILKDRTIDFDDRLVAAEAIRSLGK